MHKTVVYATIDHNGTPASLQLYQTLFTSFEDEVASDERPVQIELLQLEHTKGQLERQLGPGSSPRLSQRRDPHGAGALAGAGDRR